MQSYRLHCNIAVPQGRLRQRNKTAHRPEIRQALALAVVFQPLPKGGHHIVFLSRCAVGYGLRHTRCALLAWPVPPDTVNAFRGACSVTNQIRIVLAGNLQVVTIMRMGLTAGACAFRPGALPGHALRRTAAVAPGGGAALGKDDGGRSQNPVRNLVTSLQNLHDYVGRRRLARRP